MWIDLPNTWIAVINILGIPLCHLAIAWLSTLLPDHLFQRPLPCSCKPNGFYYKHLLRVRQWKNLLPDAAPWFRGFAKGKLQSTEPTYLRTFINETRRGEFSHWLQMVCIAFFIIWTPNPWSLIILIYAILSNAPCIINLRYTRLRITALILKKYS